MDPFSCINATLVLLDFLKNNNRCMELKNEKLILDSKIVEKYASVQKAKQVESGKKGTGFPYHKEPESSLTFAKRLRLLQMDVENSEAEKCALELVKDDPQAICYVPQALKTKEFYLAMVRQDPTSFYMTPIAIRNEAMYIAYVQDNGHFLSRVPRDEQTERVCLAAVKNDERALYFVPEALKEKCLAAIKKT